MKGLRGLKFVLWVVGLCFLAAFSLMWMPWARLTATLTFAGKYVGVSALPGTPEVIYLFRIICGLVALVGLFFLLLALDPLPYGRMVTLGGWGLMFMGAACILAGIASNVPWQNYVLAGVFCLTLGMLIIVPYSVARKAAAGQETGEIDEEMPGAEF